MRFSALLLPIVGSSERIWLKDIPNFPTKGTLETVRILTARANDNSEISLAGPVRLNKEIQADDKFSLAIIPYSKKDQLSKGEFCEDGKFKMDDAYGFQISNEAIQTGFNGLLFQLTHTGSYYVALVNCAPHPAGAEGGKAADAKLVATDYKFESGELVLVTRYGNLPASEMPKLTLYMVTAIGFAALFGLWCVACASKPDAVFRIHHYVTAALFACMLESICCYTSLYHWNSVGHRWWSIIFVSAMVQSVKEGVCLFTLLLACLGLGVIRPRLEAKSTMLAAGLVLSFVVFDTAREVSLMNENVGMLSAEEGGSRWGEFLQALPSTLCLSLLLAWVCSALQDTIQLLEEQKQTVKLGVYTSLRISLVICALIAMSPVVGQLIFQQSAGEDYDMIWPFMWIESDLVYHVCNVIVMLTVMYLWRPSERSVQLMWSEQVSDQKDGMVKQQDDFQEVELGDIRETEG